MFEQILYGVGGWAGGVLMMIIKEWWTRDDIAKGLEHRMSALAFMEKARALGIPTAQVDAMIASLGGKRKGAAEKVDPEAELEIEEWAEIEAATSQQDMNNVARTRFERLDRRMEVAYDRLRRLMPPEFVSELEAAQAAWKEFRDREAELAGAPWQGGSMRPFIVAGAMSHVTKHRAADLEAQVAEFAGITR